MTKSEERYKRLVMSLRSYIQADEEGIFVTVSRQACDEGADLIEDLRQRVAELEEEPYTPAGEAMREEIIRLRQRVAELKAEIVGLRQLSQEDGLSLDSYKCKVKELEESK